MSIQDVRKTLDKSTGISNFGNVKGFSRDRPWLLPSNRKLRHLQGISLRNLSLSPSTSRPRGKTIDDESLPYTLKTPAKILAQRESPKLEHSRSSNDLQSQGSGSASTLGGDAFDGSTDAKARPSSSKLRRRSTLNWTNASSRVRQTKLEDVAREKMVDSWFSIHTAGFKEPIYISEVVEKAMNPSFRFFDLDIYGPAVTRQNELVLKFWMKSESSSEYMLLVQVQLCLRSLQFIGKSLESFHQPLPQNCVLFHLSDGIYTSFADFPLEEPVLATPRMSKQKIAPQPTSSFDALMRLSNLDDCVQDALATRERLASQISSVLVEQRQSLNTVNAATQAEERLNSTNRSLATTRKSSKATQNKRSELQNSLESRRKTISLQSANENMSRSQVESLRSDLLKIKALWKESRTLSTGQTRRICEDLLKIYPIEPFEQKPLSFTIRGLYLPITASTSSTETDPIITAAALGYVAHIIYLLSLYLLTPLPYPPSPHGSMSTIFDPISASMPSVAARTFPLYQKGAVAYRFEYGVFLLNSDIELLMSRQGSRMVDLRHTLPNLKYLLTVLATGKGELPARKKPTAKGLGNGLDMVDLRMNGKSPATEKGSCANGKPSELRAMNNESL